MTDHSIICGYGPGWARLVGGRSSAAHKAPFVVIRPVATRAVNHLADPGYLFMRGRPPPPTRFLMAAGVGAGGRAGGCPRLRRRQHAVVTLSRPGAEPGYSSSWPAPTADEAYQQAGRGRGQQGDLSLHRQPGGAWATMLLPALAVTDYLEVVTGAGRVGSSAWRSSPSNATCEGGGPGRSKELDIRNRTGASILAVRHGTGRFDTNPDPNLVLSDEDTSGRPSATPDEMVRLEEYFACQPAAAVASRGAPGAWSTTTTRSRTPVNTVTCFEGVVGPMGGGAGVGRRPAPGAGAPRGTEPRGLRHSLRHAGGQGGPTARRASWPRPCVSGCWVILGWPIWWRRSRSPARASSTFRLAPDAFVRSACVPAGGGAGRGAGRAGEAPAHPAGVRQRQPRTGLSTWATAATPPTANALDRLLGFSGHRGEHEFYINDYGRQMDMFAARWPPATPRASAWTCPFPTRATRGTTWPTSPPPCGRR